MTLIKFISVAFMAVHTYIHTYVCTYIRKQNSTSDTIDSFATTSATVDDNHCNNYNGNVNAKNVNVRKKI